MKPLRFMDGPVTILQGLHPTAGLDGFPADDFGAPGGTLVCAPYDGVVPVSRPYGQGRESPGAGFTGMRVYLQDALTGWESFMAHFGVLLIKPGDRFRLGDPIGHVKHWPGQPWRSHTHWGFEGGEPLGLLVNAAGTLLRGPAPAEHELEMPFMRKVGHAGCVACTGNDGRWQVVRVLPDGKEKLIVQTTWGKAKEILEEKRAWVERQNAKR